MLIYLRTSYRNFCQGVILTKISDLELKYLNKFLDYYRNDNKNYLLCLTYALK